MKCTCPACGKKTAIEADVGDFPARCQRCGKLLRRPPGEGTADTQETPRALPVKKASSARGVRIEQGVLAGLLISDSREDAPMEAAIQSREQAPDDRRVISRHGRGEGNGRLLRPESLREIARVNARQKALKKASLRGTFQALGALGTVAFFVAAALFVGALALEARALLQPGSTRADVLKSSLQGRMP